MREDFKSRDPKIRCGENSLEASCTEELQEDPPGTEKKKDGVPTFRKRGFDRR